MKLSRLVAVAAVAVFALVVSLLPAGAATTLGEPAFAPQLITVDTPTRADKDRLVAMGLDLTEHAGHDYIEVVVHAADELDLLREAGFDWEVRIADMIQRERERIELDAAFAAANPQTVLPSGRNSYRVLADFGNEIDALVDFYADKGPGGTALAKRISIGQSVEGRDLTGIEIGVDVDEPEDGRPVFLMFGAHHAREWPSAELPMEFAYTLLEGFTGTGSDGEDLGGADPRIVDLLTRGRAIIVPVSNPDGYDASRTTGDVVDLRSADGGGTASVLATPGNAYKRKNCRYVDGQTQPAGTCAALPSNGGLGVGIDLNRNYGALWGGPGASGDPTSALYRGPAPFSEPETQAIRNLISTRQVTTLITNHTFSNLILRPVGVQPATIGPDANPIGFSPDECFATAAGGDYGMQTLGERMAAQNGYSNQFGWELYDTTGTTEDYSYNATGGYGYTFEIGPDEFHPPYEDVVAEYAGTTRAAQDLADGFTDPAELTTAAGDDCGHDVDHSAGVGGGNQEAFLIAFSNAVDADTHSVITGQAPTGAEITVERSGTFPLWDGTPFSDTVATTMTVEESGEFAYHVNPSTRPFVDSRKALQLGEPVSQLQTTGVVPPLLSEDTTFAVEEDTDAVRAQVSVTVPVDGQVVSYAQMHLQLISPQGQVVASATEFGPSNSLLWNPEEGVAAGDYTLRVINNIGATSAYELEAFAVPVLGEFTQRTEESWSVSCDGGDPVEVLVDRGESVDVGALC